MQDTRGHQHVPNQLEVASRMQGAQAHPRSFRRYVCRSRGIRFIRWHQREERGLGLSTVRGDLVVLAQKASESDLQHVFLGENARKTTLLLRVPLPRWIHFQF